MKVDIVRDEPPVKSVNVFWTRAEAEFVYHHLCLIHYDILGPQLHNLRLQLGTIFDKGGE